MSVLLRSWTSKRVCVEYDCFHKSFLLNLIVLQLVTRSWKLFMTFLTFLWKGILLKSWGFKDPKFKCWVMMWADIPFDVVYVLKILITKPNEVWKYLCLKNVIHFMYPFYFHIRKCIFINILFRRKYKPLFVDIWRFVKYLHIIAWA